MDRAAQALIDEGELAARLLRPLLDDRRAAPSWGIDDAAEYLAYQYRVRDYAWALSAEAVKRKAMIPTDVPPVTA